MRIVTLNKERIPEVIGGANNFTDTIFIEAALGTKDIALTEYKGVSVYCRRDEREEIKSYWPGKYEEPAKNFS